MVKIMFFNLGIKGLRNLVHLLIIIKKIKYLGWDCKTFFSIINYFGKIC
jgi:hypothetical protein